MGIIIKPEWQSPTHSAVFESVEELLEKEALTYAHFSQIVSRRLSVMQKLGIRALSIFLILKWAIIGRNRYAISFRGICLSHSIAEVSIRYSEHGSFHILRKSTMMWMESFIAHVLHLPNLFKENRVELVIGGDEGYGAGIYLQVASRLNIPIIHFKEIRRKVYQFTYNQDLLYSGIDYRKIVLARTAPDALVEKRKESILKRVSGDHSSLPYMRGTSTRNEIIEHEAENFAVLYLHDFMDSPGIYGRNIFLDQWEWIDRSLALCQKHDLTLLIKLHPNAHERNAKAIARIKSLESDSMRIIPGNIHLQQLKSARLLLTMFGSVVEEAAMLSIPVLTTSNHPLVWTPMCHNANTKVEFDRLFAELVCGELSSTLTHEQIAMHSLTVSEILDGFYVGDFSYDDLDSDAKLQLPEGSSSWGINERRSYFLNLDCNSSEYKLIKRKTKQKATESLRKSQLFKKTTGSLTKV